MPPREGKNAILARKVELFLKSNSGLFDRTKDIVIAYCSSIYDGPY